MINLKDLQTILLCCFCLDCSHFSMQRLVDVLEKKTHLPAVLQSLGCIAQTAMPVFETRGNEVEEYVINNILKCDNVSLSNSHVWRNCLR